MNEPNFRAEANRLTSCFAMGRHELAAEIESALKNYYQCGLEHKQKELANGTKE